MRKERAQKVANNWLNIIKEDLKKRVTEEALKNFNEWLAEGNKLTHEQLRQLNDTWKASYIKHQLLEDKVIQELLQAQQEIISKEFEEVANTRMDIYNTVDELPSHLRKFDANIKKRMI